MPAIGDLMTLGGALLTGGVAFGGLAVLVKQMSTRLTKHIESDEVLTREVIDRLARIETLLEKW